MVSFIEIFPDVTNNLIYLSCILWYWQRWWTWSSWTHGTS